VSVRAQTLLAGEADVISTEQLKSQHSAFLEKLGGGVLTKEIEAEMKTLISSHVADFSA
jgi:F-type H+-transporting ATPase subunit alpha